MNSRKKCLILIFLFLAIFSRTSYAETEGGICQNCYLYQQPSNKIESLAHTSDWVKVEIPKSVQTSQLDAGLPMGCLLTSMMYALKYGPEEYKKAYKNIPGSSDLEKIR
ncbi:MAG: hypothetical protein AAGB31_16240, partial [Bdellovibrio sp.]